MGREWVVSFCLSLADLELLNIPYGYLEVVEVGEIPSFSSGAKMR